MWMMRSNMRGRFFFEQYGFRNEYINRTITWKDQEIRLTQYVYRGPEGSQQA